MRRCEHCGAESPACGWFEMSAPPCSLDPDDLALDVSPWRCIAAMVILYGIPTAFLAWALWHLWG
jgi:hypothetical protein